MQARGQEGECVFERKRLKWLVFVSVLERRCEGEGLKRGGGGGMLAAHDRLLHDKNWKSVDIN